MKALRVLVVGGGHLGKIHLKLLHDHVASAGSPKIIPVGLVDPVSTTRESLSQQWNLPTFAACEECHLPFDAAIIATPTRTHFEVARSLLLEGKHLLIEKPLTFTARDSQQLIDLAKDRDLVIQVGHVERFNPVFQAARDCVERPRYIELHRASRFTGRSTDVGVVMDLMIHDIDLMLHLVDAEVHRVEAIGVSVFGDHEDMAQARITFTNGAVANLWASRCSYTPQRTVKIMGTNGFAHADLTTRQVTTVIAPEEVQAKRLLYNRLSPEAKRHLTDQLFDQVLPQKTFEVPGSNPLLDEQADFFRSVANGSLNQVPAVDGHRAVVVANQILAAIRAHAWTENSFGPRGPLVSIDQFTNHEPQRQVA
ncbi:MAG: Gfo/Idh/MocA family oxidoreductase [Planctomycetaceae bacterium]|nr:Gfo/Idh/MocA family oxidoreductase [Planctomycetaceae bacterium]